MPIPNLDTICYLIQIWKFEAKSETEENPLTSSFNIIFASKSSFMWKKHIFSSKETKSISFGITLFVSLRSFPCISCSMINKRQFPLFRFQTRLFFQFILFHYGTDYEYNSHSFLAWTLPAMVCVLSSWLLPSGSWRVSLAPSSPSSPSCAGMTAQNPNQTVLFRFLENQVL